MFCQCEIKILYLSVLRQQEQNWVSAKKSWVSELAWTRGRPVAE